MPHAHGLTITKLTDRFGLQLTGEADLNDEAVLCDALANLRRAGNGRHAGNGREVVVLKLDKLSFAGARALASIAELADDLAPRQLVLEHPTACLRRILSILWPEPPWTIR